MTQLFPNLNENENSQITGISTNVNTSNMKKTTPKHIIIKKVLKRKFFKLSEKNNTLCIEEQLVRYQISGWNQCKQENKRRKKETINLQFYNQ